MANKTLIDRNLCHAIIHNNALTEESFHPPVEQNTELLLHPQVVL